MSANIDIHHPHQHTIEDAKAGIVQIAKKMAEKLSVDSHWKGDTLSFSRSGIQGRISITQNDIHVHVELGFLMRALKPVIQHEIEYYLSERFS